MAGAWRTLALEAAFGTGRTDPIPFFIRRMPESPRRHPSQDSPLKGCDLTAFAIALTPTRTRSELLAHTGIDAEARQAKRAGLDGDARHAEGRVTLSSSSRA